jgi:hypothetical protein
MNVAHLHLIVEEIADRCYEMPVGFGPLRYRFIFG